MPDPKPQTFYDESLVPEDFWRWGEGEKCKEDRLKYTDSGLGFRGVLAKCRNNATVFRAGLTLCVPCYERLKEGE